MAFGDVDDPVDYGTIVRNNLMKRPGYAPYCMGCSSMSRMVWDGEQFKHSCGTRTEFPADFIAAYKERRALLSARQPVATAHRKDEETPK